MSPKRRRRSLQEAFLLFALLLLPASAGGTEQDVLVVERVELTIETPGGSDPGFVEKIRRLIGVTAGDRIDGEALARIERFLEETRFFSEVSVRFRPHEGGVVTAGGARIGILSVRLRQPPRIADVRIFGNAPLLEEEVMQILTRYPGDGMGDPTVEEDRIRRRYLAEGFIDPRVWVRTRKTLDPHEVVLSIFILPGRYFRLRHLEIDPGGLDLGGIRFRMKTWRRSFYPGRSGRFIERELEADIHAIVEALRKENDDHPAYPDAVIEREIVRDVEAGAIDLRLVVHPGTGYRTRFTGNEAIGEATLRGVIRKAPFREARATLRSWYERRGFSEVRITETQHPLAPGLMERRFSIEEGVQRRIADVIFEGNHALSAEELSTVVQSRPAGLLHKGYFDREVIASDREAILERYAEGGFLDAQVAVEHSERGGRVFLTFRITEGMASRIGAITFEGGCGDAPKRVMPQLRSAIGAPLTPPAVEFDRRALVSRLSEGGHPYARVTAVAEPIEGGEGERSMRLSFQCVPGPPVEVGEIFLQGLLQTRPRTVLAEIPLRRGAPFSLLAVQEALSRIRELGVFQAVSVRVLGLEEKAPVVHLLFRMEERVPHTVDLGVGYESDLGWNGFFELGDHDLLGRAWDLRLRGSGSEDRQFGEIGLTDPRFLGGKIRARYGLFAERRRQGGGSAEVESLHYGASAGFFHRWSTRVSSGFTTRYERRLILAPTLPERIAQPIRALSEAQGRRVFDPDVAGTRDTLVFSPSLTWDARDSLIRPHRGIFATMSLDVNTGLTRSLDFFVRAMADVRGYVTPWPVVTFSGIVRGGGLRPYGETETIPADQRFYLGGSADLLGFAADSIRPDDPATGLPGDVGGTYFLFGALEARIPLPWDFEIALFLDNGIVTNDLGAFTPSAFRHSTGGGLRYLTPVGPIGLLYGINLDRRPGEVNGRFHFSIGYTF